MLQNLDRLKVFHYVFTNGSIVAAANILHVSQSAVSQSVKKLEQEVQTPLFTRLHKQLIPTSAGKQLFHIVQPFMVSLDGYLKELEFAKDYPAGELYIGSPPEFGKTYLPSIVAGFREHYPEVTFTIKLGTPEKLLPLVRQGKIDFALVDTFLTRSTHIGHLDAYHFKPVVEEEVILACSRTYYEKYMNGDHSFASLVRQNYISYKEDHETIRQWFKHHFGQTAGGIRDVLIVDSHEAVISAIMNSVGLGIVASHLITEHLCSGTMVHITTPKPDIVNSISFVQLQDKIPTHTERVFEKFLIENITEMISTKNAGMNVLKS